MSRASKRVCRAIQARRVERVEPCCSTSSTQPKCVDSTRPTCRVVLRRDVTRRAKWNLGLTEAYFENWVWLEKSILDAVDVEADASLKATPVVPGCRRRRAASRRRRGSGRRRRGRRRRRHRRAGDVLQDQLRRFRLSGSRLARDEHTLVSPITPHRTIRNVRHRVAIPGGPKKVSHYHESSLNRIKTRH